MARREHGRQTFRMIILVFEVVIAELVVRSCTHSQVQGEQLQELHLLREHQLLLVQGDRGLCLFRMTRQALEIGRPDAHAAAMPVVCISMHMCVWACVLVTSCVRSSPMHALVRLLLSHTYMCACACAPSAGPQQTCWYSERGACAAGL